MSSDAAAAAIAAPKRSTLTYTLLDSDKITWTEFSIIVRSLHSYEVLDINEDPESKTIAITVAYFANAGNARLRLGGAGEFIAVNRESSNVAREELQTLQKLRSQFGFGRNAESEDDPPSKSHKKRRYANRT